MVTALAAAALAVVFALMLLLRRDRRLPADDAFLDVARSPELVVSLPPARGEEGPAVATMPVPEPPAPWVVPVFPPPPAPDLELVCLAAWRREQLVRLGVPGDEAEEAAREGVDAAAVRSLVESGCPPRLALRIVR